MRYFMRVEYDGSRYGGWQRQPNAPTVQQSLEEAFAIVLREPCRVTGAGRTDAGVHARGQGAHVDCTGSINLERTTRAINALLPPDIAIHDLREVDQNFHARFSAVRRRYCYLITTRKHPLLTGRAWMVKGTVDWEKATALCAQLPGTRDCAVFCCADTDTRSMICRIEESTLVRTDIDVWQYTIVADRFVYRMVRSIVGTVIDTAQGRREGTLADVIGSGSRRCAGQTAPPWGLVLDSVEYPSFSTASSEDLPS